MHMILHVRETAVVCRPYNYQRRDSSRLQAGGLNVTWLAALTTQAAAGKGESRARAGARRLARG